MAAYPELRRLDPLNAPFPAELTSGVHAARRLSWEAESHQSLCQGNPTMDELSHASPHIPACTMHIAHRSMRQRDALCEAFSGQATSPTYIRPPEMG